MSSHLALTFLLTDVENSVPLWEKAPARMREAVQRHDLLASEQIGLFQGILVKSRGEGDSLFAVFPEALSALKCAAALQEAFEKELWPHGVPIKVRMGIHTGEAALRDGDYYGPNVIRTARLRSIGHGGQILVSQAARDLAHSYLPSNMGLLPLGSFILKGMAQPEPVYQLTLPSLPARFPPLTAPEARSVTTNLPLQVTSFIGREQEKEELFELLSSSRLITIVGAGGCGKTRLALQAASLAAADYPDGTWLVEFAGVTEPRFAAQAAVNVFGLREESGLTPIEILGRHLSTKRALLLLDNCEHIRSGAAEMVGSLLSAAPDITILTTSQEALGREEEIVYPLGPLALPPSETSLEELADYEAVQLFLERAQSFQPAFAPVPQNRSTLIRLCQRLDGIPLALELAAARLRSLTLEEIEARLDNRFRLLSSQGRAAGPRHQTLKALIDWSYGLLSEPERILFARLSVFADAPDYEAIEAVCADEEGPLHREVIRPLLLGLAGKSLLIYREEEGRFKQLETLRQYALQRLTEKGEEEEQRRKLMAWCLMLTETASAHLRGAGQQEWLKKLKKERGNLYAALDWRHSEPNMRLKLAVCMGDYWTLNDQPQEGRGFLENILRETDGRSAPEIRASALCIMGILCFGTDDYQAANTFFQQSLALSGQTEQRRVVALSYMGLGDVAHSQGNYEQANALYEVSLSLIHTEQPGSAEEGDVLERRGSGALSAGDVEGGRKYYEQSLALHRSRRDAWSEARLLHTLGNTAVFQGDFAAAHTFIEEALEFRKQLEDRGGIAQSMDKLAQINAEEGNTAAARLLLEEALVLRRELGDRRGMAFTIAGMGRIALIEGNYEEARRFYEEGLVFFHELGNRSNAAYILVHLCMALCRSGDTSRAAFYLQEAAAYCRETNQTVLAVTVLRTAAELALEQKAPERGACLLGCARALQQTLDLALPPVHAADQAELEVKFLQKLGAEGFADALCAGEASSWKELLLF